MELQLTIDRFEGNEAVLITKDGENIVWPKSRLPENAREGEVLTFIVISENEKTEDKKQLAKDILNEILNPDDVKE